MSEGWHPDPLGRYAQRYHNGSTWTSHVSNVGGVTEEDPMGIAPSAPGMPVAPPVGAYDGDGSMENNLASRGMRLLAQILDGLILGVPLFLISDALWGFTDDWVLDFEAEIVEVGIPIEVAVFWAVASAAYSIGMIGSIGRTLGKMVCGLTVVTEDGSELPGYGRATIRYGIYWLYGLPWVPALGTLLFIATVVMAFATPLRQTLHDKAARTVVVRAGWFRGR